MQGETLTDNLTEIRRCKKCIIPETAKGIKFNEDGVCQVCQNHKEFTPKGEKALLEKVRECLQENRNQTNNCVVPVSGGRDSAYVLYYAKEVLHLKPVALHSDNDFEAPIAVENLKVNSQKLNVPLIRVKSRSQLGKKIVAEKYKMNAPFGQGLIADQMCEACKYAFEAASYNYARDHGISIIMWGDSVFENTGSYHNIIREEHKVPSKWKRLISPGPTHMFKYRYYFNQMKKEYGSDAPDGLNEIHLFDYIQWDQNVIVETIKKELGWKAPEESVTTWRVDCLLVPLVDYLTKKAFGVSKLELGFSVMVRSGRMNRDDAIKKVDQISKNFNVDDLKKLLQGMGISEIMIDQTL